MKSVNYQIEVLPLNEFKNSAAAKEICGNDLGEEAELIYQNGVYFTTADGTAVCGPYNRRSRAIEHYGYLRLNGILPNGEMGKIAD